MILIDIEDYDQFYRGLCDNGILQMEDIVTGSELHELVRLCKRYATKLERHLVQQGRDEDLAALKRTKCDTDARKRLLGSIGTESVANRNTSMKYKQLEKQV